MLTLYLYTTILNPLSIIRQRYFFCKIVITVGYFTALFGITLKKSVGGFICLLFYRERAIKKEKNDTSSALRERQKGKHIDAE